jgi:3-hydroxyisobutyrate dehydrogenase-like beta-hydroxyacid dehydrogenase
MGSALAWCLVADGHEVTVWNRSREKAKPFAEHGVAIADSAASALDASPVTILCVSDYATVNQLLFATDAVTSFAERLLVNYTAGTPGEARLLAARLAGLGADYLDANLGCYPSAIGGEHTNTTYAGPLTAFERAHPIVRTIGQDAQHVGEDPGTANAVLLVMSAYLGAALMGFFEAAAYGNVQGLDFAGLAAAARQCFPTIEAYLAHVAEHSRNGVRPADEASADVWLHALATAQGEMHAAEIRANVIDAMVEVLLDVRERGHGQDEFGIVVYEHALRSRVGT